MKPLIERSLITQLRIERGWSQGDLSRAASVTRADVSRAENGWQLPRIVNAIGKALDVEPSRLSAANKLDALAAAFGLSAEEVRASSTPAGKKLHDLLDQISADLEALR